METPSASRLIVVAHPLVRSKLTRLRDRKTGTDLFRRLIHEIAGLMAFEATRHVETVPEEVQTPVASYSGRRIARPLVVVPILRAGLAMVGGFADALIDASVGHVGIARNETTAEPATYYFKLPKHAPDSDVFVVDPMLATGGSASDAIAKIKAQNVTRITFVCLVASQAGIRRLAADHPDITIVTAEIDPLLNEKFYIVPGLGDAGDRYFGTQ